MPAIQHVQLVVGLEVHVELATRTKMFSRCPSPAAAGAPDPEPNALIDPVVLALPGSLPVMNRAAVELAIRVGLALRCSIAPFSKWDRKSYFYPDLPKAYQISQYDLPLCFDGEVDLPLPDSEGFPDFSKPATRIGVIRAHLEEDAGKLLHEAPGGRAIDHSIVDLNRAGTPLLEIVTQPDFRDAGQAVLFARLLRSLCRFLGATEGVMQRGHMRFEPNINCHLTLGDGRLVQTPVVEIKNLNSFKSLRGAIDFELRDQPRRWLEDGREMGPGAKITRGWDDARAVTFVQREKEDAHDYRYFPDPDLVPVVVSHEWRERIAADIPEAPLARFRRYVERFGLGAKEAWALIEERDDNEFYEAGVEALTQLGVERDRAGKLAANLLLQHGLKRANETGTPLHDLGITPRQVGELGALREQGRIGNQGVVELFNLACDAADESLVIESLAGARGLLVVRDDAALARWVEQAIAENPQAAADVRAGKPAAVGRIVGAAMKLASGQGDAKVLREMILERLARPA